MKHNRRIVLPLFLILSMLLSAIPVSSYAAGNISITLGNPLFSTDTAYSFPSLTVAPDNPTTTISAIIISADVKTASGSTITLPTDTSEFTVAPTVISDLNDLTKTIVFTVAQDASKVQTYLRQVTFSAPASGPQQITISGDNNTTSNIDAGTSLTAYTNHPDGTTHYYAHITTTPDVTWVEAYNDAKAMKFMGMQGYLVTITSPEENNMLNNISTVGAWSGGTRLVFNGSSGTTDNAEIADQGSLNINSFSQADPNEKDNYYWACGPETGLEYSIGKKYSDSGFGLDPDAFYAADASKGITEFADKSVPSKFPWAYQQPDNYDYTPLGMTEPCMQVNQVSTYKWNDLPLLPASGSNTHLPGFFVEFGGYTGSTDTIKNVANDPGAPDPALTATASASVLKTYSLGISATSGSISTALPYGYTTPQGITYTIKNTGNTTVSGLTASLTSGASFEISSALSASSLGVDETATVTVRLKTGLAISGTAYTDTLKVTGTNVPSSNAVSVDLSQSVVKAAPPAIVWPTGLTAAYTQTLGDIILTDNDSNGSFAWKEPASTSVGSSETTTSAVVYTPDDVLHYDYSTVSGWNSTDKTVVKDLTITVTGIPSTGHSHSNTTATDDNKAPVYINNTEYKIGTVTQSTDPSSGSQTTVVTVDAAAYDKQISNSADNSTIIVPIPEKDGSSAYQAVLTARMVDEAAQRSMDMEIQSDGISYIVPAAAVDIDALTKALGAGASADQTTLQFTIAKCPEKTTQFVKSSVEGDGFTMMVAPLDFSLSATYNGRTVSVDTFSNYVTRVIPIPADVDASKITTAIVVAADGTERHVPTDVYKGSDGIYYARVSCLTNSIYTLIHNSRSFADAKGKWYQDIVSEMASRTILDGRTADVFDGGANITRAEFAAVLVRGLGLSSNGTSSFSDVSKDSWYYGAVGKAYEYKIISGTGDNRFDPNAYITRQDAMLMIQRAASIAEYSGVTGTAPSGFTDADSVSSYAKNALAFNLTNGLIVGNNGLIRPHDNISRAEAATVVLKLLQKSGLIDVRTAV